MAQKNGPRLNFFKADEEFFSLTMECVVRTWWFAN
jgi:hypothetical protein